MTDIEIPEYRSVIRNSFYITIAKRCLPGDPYPTRGLLHLERFHLPTRRETTAHILAIVDKVRNGYNINTGLGKIIKNMFDKGITVEFTDRNNGPRPEYLVLRHARSTADVEYIGAVTNPESPVFGYEYFLDLSEKSEWSVRLPLRHGNLEDSLVLQPLSVGNPAGFMLYDAGQLSELTYMVSTFSALVEGAQRRGENILRRVPDTSYIRREEAAAAILLQANPE